MKNLFSFYLCCFFSISCFAQGRYLEGFVQSEAGVKLEGASVSLQGATFQTRSDKNGYFRLPVRDSTITLVISLLGFETSFVTVNFPFKENLLIELQQKAEQLQEVVVSTGYEKTPLERLTGSFEKIDEQLINRSVSTDILSRIEHVTSGIYFNRQSYNFNFQGRPSSHNINVHGISTLRAANTGGNAPLIVLDNFPYEGDINNLNPNDIESITVLKDAAASSIWGAKAGNGVIVITTKKASYANPLRIRFNQNVNILGKPDLFSRPVINNADLIAVQRDLFERGFYNNMETNRARPALPPFVELLIKQRKGLMEESEVVAAAEAYGQQDVRQDMLQYLYRANVNQQYALNFSGGTENYNYLLSGDFDKVLATRVGDQNRRYTLRTEHGFRPLKNLEFQTRLQYAGSESLTAGDAEYYGNNGYKFPYVRLKDGAGRAAAIPRDYSTGYLSGLQQTGLLDWEYRPLDEIGLRTDAVKGKELMLNLGMNYKIVKWLSADLKYQYSWTDYSGENLATKDSYHARNLINRFSQISNGNVSRAIPLGGILEKNESSAVAQLARGQLNFNWQAKDLHRLDALVGFEIQERRNKSNASTTYGYDEELLTYATNVDFFNRYPIFDNLASPSAIMSGLSFASSTDRFVSTFANASYTFNGKYLLSGSARRDASNLFGLQTNDKWTPLWSVGMGWNVSEEPFFKLPYLSFLKMRATYGYSGNVDNTMSALTTISYNNFNSIYGVNWPAASIQNPPNPNLRWERVRNINLGLDFSIKGNRVTGTIDYYWKHTEDLFHFSPLDPTVGVISMTMNVANTKSKGLDLRLNTNNIIGKFGWSSNLVFSYNNNWITKTFVEYTGPASVLSGGLVPYEGNMIYGLYSYRWVGLDPEKGTPRGYFQGEISDDFRRIQSVQTSLDDLVFHGSARPLVFGAVRNTFTYLNFSLSANVSYKFSYFFRRQGLNYASLFNNADGHRDFYNRWQKPGDELHTDIPAMEYPIGLGNGFYQFSEILVEKGDHIRLQDVRLSYTYLPKKKWAGLQRCELFVYGGNLGIIWRANKRNLDPEVGGNIPAPRSIALGVNLQF